MSIYANNASGSRLIAGLVAALLASAAMPVSAQTTSGSLIMITDDIDAPSGTSSDAAPAFRPQVAKKPIKVEAGSNFEVAVDNGWVIYEGLNNNPTLNFYDVDSTKLGSFKLEAASGATTADGDIYEAGGIVFAPCAIAAQTRCMASEGGSTGVGIGFGEVNDSGSAGGWVNNDDLKASLTNADGSPGSLDAAAVNPGVAAFAVGWDTDATGYDRARAVMLDAVGETYNPTAQIDLGTLGGTTSQAFGISKATTYIVGVANTASNKGHAVYALSAGAISGCGPTTAGAVSTCWIDLTSTFPAALTAAGFPAGSAVLKSRALVANDAGFIAGSAQVKETLYSGAAERKVEVSVGFVYNINTSTMTMFGATDADVLPMAVLSDGTVTGELQEIAPKGSTGGLPVYHPFVATYSSTDMTVTDLGLLPNQYSCRVNGANQSGELVGGCIPDGSTAFGAGTAFYVDATAQTPTMVDLNADLHAMNDASNPTYKNYVYTAASWIDDEHEITVLGILTAKSGSVARGGFLAQPGSY